MRSGDRVFVLLLIILISLVSVYLLQFVQSTGFLESSFIRFDFRVGFDTVPELAEINLERGKKVKITLVISELPHQKGSNIYIKSGEFLLITTSGSEYRIGDKIEAVGSLEPRVTGDLNRYFVLKYPDISLVSFGASKGWDLRWQLRRELANVQSILSRLLAEGLSEPHASLLTGILLGLDSQMPKEFYQALVKTGTIHVIAASGYNVTVVARVLIGVFGLLVSRKKAIWLAVLGVVFYTLVAGAEPPVVRAAIMATLVFVAEAWGREYIASWSLVLTGVAMLAFDPQLVESVGFWLSIGATGGILWLSKPLENGLNWAKNALMSFDLLGTGDKKVTLEGAVPREGFGLVVVVASSVLKYELITTVAAQIGTMGLIVAVFGRLSVVSPLVNVLVLWMVPTIMALGAVKLLFGFLSPSLGYVMVLLVWPLLELFVVLVEWFGGLGFASVDLSKWGLFDVVDNAFGVGLAYYLVLALVYVGVKYGLLRKNRAITNRK